MKKKTLRACFSLQWTVERRRRGDKGARYSRRYGRELVSKNDDLVEEKLGSLP